MRKILIFLKKLSKFETIHLAFFAVFRLDLLNFRQRLAVFEIIFFNNALVNDLISCLIIQRRNVLLFSIFIHFNCSSWITSSEDYLFCSSEKIQFKQKKFTGNHRIINFEKVLHVTTINSAFPLQKISNLTSTWFNKIKNKNGKSGKPNKLGDFSRMCNESTSTYNKIH